jgi:uncharacterized protein (TIGR02996 family)
VIDGELLRAVIESPDDDAPRLVYADALLDAGDPRGELITLQCREIADPDAIAHAIERARPAWQAFLGDAVTEICLFERGFPTNIELAISSAAPPLSALDRMPIRYLRLRSDDPIDRPAAAEQFAADGRTARIHALDLTGESWGEPVLRTLLAADLRGLRRLFIGDHDAQTHVAPAIRGNPTLHALELLELSGETHADFADGLALFTSWPSVVASLQSLRLESCKLGPLAGALIASSRAFANLRELDLSSDSTTTRTLDDSSIVALAHSFYLTKLESLSVGSNPITDEGVAALANPAALPALRSLALNCTNITARGLSTLVNARPFEELYIGGCARLGDEGAVAFARSPHVRNPRCLNLHGSNVDEEGVRALIASPIERLDWLGIDVDTHLKWMLIGRFGAEALK